MAYKIQRRQSEIADTLELYDVEGNLAETITWAVNGEELIKTLPNIQKELIAAQQGSNTEKIGKAIVELLAAIFGMENTNKILIFYEKRYLEMLEDLTPYIRDVVYPKVTEYSHKNAERLKALKNQVKWGK